MMPVRKRLWESMFEVATLRSSTGIQAIHDMMALYEQERERWSSGPVYSGLGMDIDN